MVFPGFKVVRNGFRPAMAHVYQSGGFDSTRSGARGEHQGVLQVRHRPRQETGERDSRCESSLVFCGFKGKPTGMPPCWELKTKREAHFDAHIVEMTFPRNAQSETSASQSCFSG